MAPQYLCELMSIRKSSRKLRSSSQILLQVTVSRLKSYGNCVFSVAVSTLWNKLPANIRNAPSLENFNPVLKAHLFMVAFTDFYRYIIWGIIILHIICTAPLNGSCQ